MRVLCRKFCPHELSEVEGNDGEHLIGAATEEELELEDEAMETVANAAIEMGMQQSDFKAELKRASGDESLLSDIKRFDVDLTGSPVSQAAGEVMT